MIQQRFLGDGRRLPQRFPPRQAEGGKGAAVRQRLRLAVPQLAPPDHIGNGCKRCLTALALDAFAGFFAEAGDIAQAEAETEGAGG